MTTGRYYAAWERIVFLFVPYFDVPVTERLFLNGERARLQFSAQNRYPGLFTSVECATEPNNYTWHYYEALGIEVRIAAFLNSSF
jgi:hypothetical protein